MVRKTFKAGNCIAISLPPEALDYLGIQEGSEVSVELDRQVKDFIEQYRPVLEVLGK